MNMHAVNPRRYHEAAEPMISPIAQNGPVCLYLETTNRCNLLCTRARAPSPNSSRRRT